MNKIIGFVSLFLAFGVIADAQTLTIKNDTLVGTGVTSAATHTRGGGQFRYLKRGDNTAYAREYVRVTLGSVTDSFCVQLGTVTTSATSGSDTTWTPVKLTYRKAGINTAKGVAEYRDTTVAQWVTDVGRDVGTDQGFFELPPSASNLIRFMIGKNDSGVVRLQYIRVRR